MKIKPQPTVPLAVIKAIEDVPRLRYSDINTIYHALQLFSDCWLIVGGDGNNGAYEWFKWTPADGIMAHSNAGYCSPEAALRDGLIEGLS